MQKSLKNIYRPLKNAWLIALTALVCGTPQAADNLTPIQEATPNYRTDVIPVIKRDYPLFQFSTEGIIEQIKMTGLYNERHFRFFSPKNEVLSKASVTLKYTPSPALIPQQSQLNVYLNGQLQKSLPITKEQLGTLVTSSVDLNTKLIEDANRLTLEFVGQYTNVCGSVTNPALWMTVESSSYLTLNTQKVRLANDLSIFPTPFVNTLSPAPTTLPIVFAKQPSNELKQAAAIFASWAGVKTQWRGIDFPVYFNELPPEQNFVVFVTNDTKPDFLKNIPTLDAPTIIVMDAPNSLFAKVLVIGGRNAEDLLVAARWLATADKGLAGSSVKIENFVGLPQRKPYDAPNWVNTNEKTTFEQLSQYKGQLTSSGFHPAPIKVEVKLPPDLFMVNRSSVNLDLRYRYTKPTTGEPAQMRFLINDVFVESYDLNPKANSNSFNSQFSLLNGLGNLWNSTSIPSQLLSPENILSFDFQYGLAVAGGTPENCKSVSLIPNQVEIDPNSTIDFTGFYHFAKLPDLKLFTVSGFPFSRYADLSETLVLIKEDASPNVINTMLNTMARISSQTGYPATKVSLASSISSKAVKNKDLMVFSETSQSFGASDKYEPELVLSQLKEGVNQSFSDREDGKAKAQSTVAEDTGVAAIVQYESPFSSERSIVAFVGDGQDGNFLLNRRLMNPSDLKLISGSIAIFKPNAEPTSFMAGPTYFSGSLPWHQRVWYSMLDQPLLLVLFTVICALLIAAGIYYLMHALIINRSRRH